MAPPPQPYSRSMVMTRIIGIAIPCHSLLSNRQFAARAWVVSLQEERQAEHNGRTDSQDKEHINVGKSPCLRLHGFINSRISLRLRLVQAKAGMYKALGRAGYQVTETLVTWGCVADQDCLVELRPARNHRRDHGGSNAASHVAHEIDHARDGIVLLPRHPYVRDERDRHEKKT